jgi:rhamnulose-1-phosphate aldolase
MEFNSSTVGQLLKQMGEVGRRLSEIGATEGAAGNISVCVRRSLEVREIFPQVTNVELPVPAPNLRNATLIVSGSGRRLREIADSPTANLACIIVDPDGATGRMFTSPEAKFKRVTSEFNSHLAVHHDQMRSRPIDLHAVVHAQPRHLTFLSHIPKYQEQTYLNTSLMRWQPETIINIPEGIGVLPFLLPGSKHLMIETMLCMRDHRVVVWSQHGAMTRADGSIAHALDLVEYVETAAHYETLNLYSGEASTGIEPRHLRDIAEMWNVKQKVY